VPATESPLSTPIASFALCTMFIVMSTVTTPGLADLSALIDLVRARRSDHMFAGENVRPEMMATLEALAIKLAAQGLMGATAKYEISADGRLALREIAHVEAVAKGGEGPVRAGGHSQVQNGRACGKAEVRAVTTPPWPSPPPSRRL
jgi:hypothetical protein